MMPSELFPKVAKHDATATHTKVFIKRCVLTFFVLCFSALGPEVMCQYGNKRHTMHAEAMTFLFAGWYLQIWDIFISSYKGSSTEM